MLKLVVLLSAPYLMYSADVGVYSPFGDLWPVIFHGVIDSHTHTHAHTHTHTHTHMLAQTH